MDSYLQLISYHMNWAARIRWNLMFWRRYSPPPSFIFSKQMLQFWARICSTEICSELPRPKNDNLICFPRLNHFSIIFFKFQPLPKILKFLNLIWMISELKKSNFYSFSPLDLDYLWNHFQIIVSILNNFVRRNDTIRFKNGLNPKNK